MSCKSFRKVGPSLRHNKSYKRTDEKIIFAKASSGSGAMCTSNIRYRNVFFRTLKMGGHFSFFFSLKTVWGGRCLQPLPGGGRQVAKKNKNIGCYLDAPLSTGSVMYPLAKRRQKSKGVKKIRKVMEINKEPMDCND